MEFRFIDNSSSIDRTARRQIRSHVARGRNAGKRLTRSSRKNLKPGTAGSRATRGQTPKSMAALVESPHASSISIRVPASPSSLPAHWQQISGSEGPALIQIVITFFNEIRHAPELDGALDYASEPRERWIRPIFLDEAFFHGAMAVFMTANTGRDNSVAQVRHHCVALRLVNARLSGRDAISNETLTVVLVLGLYERYQGDHDRSRVHLDGLQRMVDMRGGMRELIRTGSDLARKILRADIEHSLQLSKPARFAVQDVEQLATNNTIASPNRTISDPHSNPPNPPIGLTPTLTTLLHDATYKAHLLNTASASDTDKLDSRTVHDAFIVFGYRLQAVLPLFSGTIGPAVASGMGTVEQAVYFGLEAFVGSFFWGGGSGSRKRAPLRWPAGSVRAVIHQISAHEIRGGLGQGSNQRREKEVVLWMLFIGVAADVVEPGDMDDWVVPRTGDVLSALGLEDWESVVRVLERFPWVDVLHGRHGLSHFERSRALISDSRHN